jgi:hypothetical protein
VKVHLADVGGIIDPFASRIPTRARFMRNTGTAGGGGGTGTPPEGEPEGEPDGDEDGGEGEDEEKEEDSAPTAEDFKKLQAKAARRENALRKTQAELAKLKAEKEKPEGEPDPVAKANARLLNASARTVLTAAGVTEKEDQKTILSMIDLSDVDVDEDDGPDEEAIEEKIDTLRRIFGKSSAPEKPGSRVPRGVRAPDRGKGESVDPDTARYRKIIAGRQ